MCWSLTLHNEVTDKSTVYTGPLVGDYFLFARLCFLPTFLLVLFRLRRWEYALRFLPLQFRQFGFHLDDQHLELLLALLKGVGVDVAGVLFAINPCGRVAALLQR